MLADAVGAALQTPTFVDILKPLLVRMWESKALTRTLFLCLKYVQNCYIQAWIMLTS